MTTGIIVVASEAKNGVCDQAMKNSAMAVVEGKPAMTPPNFVPNFSARTVANVIQAPPTMKLKASFRKKMSSIIICRQTDQKP